MNIPNASPDDETIDELPTPESARRLVVTIPSVSFAINAMLPSVVASEEHDARRLAAFRARQKNIPLEETAMIRDLEDILHRLVICVQDIRDKRGKLETDGQGLVYAHRATLFVLRDYTCPNTAHGKALWRTAEAIHQEAHDALAEHGRMTAALESVYRLARAALNGE